MSDTSGTKTSAEVAEGGAAGTLEKFKAGGLEAGTSEASASPKVIADLV